MNGTRICAALEIGLLTLFFVVAIWGPLLTGVTWLNVAACLFFVATVVVSAIVRRPNWRKSGFRFDNFGAGLLRVSTLLIGVTLLMLFVAQLTGVSLMPGSLSTPLGRVLSGLAQEALFLGYFYERWRTLLQRPFGAAAANASWFGLIHYPDPGLMALAWLGGLYLNVLFIRVGNVFVVGMLHGLLSNLLIPIMSDTGFMSTSRIGPPELGKFRSSIAQALQPGDRIGICSRVLVPEQFGSPFDRPVERVLRGRRNDAVIRESLTHFFAARERVFCVITDREYQRHMNGGLEKGVYILDHGYIWHNLKNKPLFQKGEGLIGIFRDRVLLVSNHPSNQP